MTGETAIFYNRKTEGDYEYRAVSVLGLKMKSATCLKSSTVLYLCRE